MITVASLFGSQTEATEALDALANSEFEDVDVRVYEEDVGEEGAGATPVGLPAAASSGIATVPVSGLSEEGLSQYFVQAVEMGQGVLVVADVEEERAADLEAFFREQGGQTAEEG